MAMWIEIARYSVVIILIVSGSMLLSLILTGSREKVFHGRNVKNLPTGIFQVTGMFSYLNQRGHFVDRKCSMFFQSTFLVWDLGEGLEPGQRFEVLDTRSGREIKARM